MTTYGDLLNLVKTEDPQAHAILFGPRDSREELLEEYLNTKGFSAEAKPIARAAFRGAFNGFDIQNGILDLSNKGDNERLLKDIREYQNLLDEKRIKLPPKLCRDTKNLIACVVELPAMDKETANTIYGKIDLKEIALETLNWVKKDIVPNLSGEPKRLAEVAIKEMQTSLAREKAEVIVPKILSCLIGIGSVALGLPVFLGITNRELLAAVGVAAAAGTITASACFYIAAQCFMQFASNPRLIPIGWGILFATFGLSAIYAMYYVIRKKYREFKKPKQK